MNPEGSQAQRIPLTSAAKCPIFVEDPRGVLAEGVPPGYTERRRPGSPEGRDAAREGQLPTGIRQAFDEDDPLGMIQETAYVFERHRQLLAVLVIVQFAIEVLFLSVYVLDARVAVLEVRVLYHMKIQSGSARELYWGFFWAEAVYAAIYYALAARAVCTSHTNPNGYKNFAGWCVVGICAMVLLAYADKFNVLLLFLRLMAYIYASFLQGLATTMSLLPMLQEGGRSNGEAVIANEAWP